jgi:DMSO/TMAO reductase YedYZ molybdopterin-dependent catalytic subunit
MTHSHRGEPEWLHGHAHEPNPAPPTATTAFILSTPTGKSHVFEVDDLSALDATDVPACYIVSTGHGTSGPFTFSGVRLRDVIDYVLGKDAHWQYADIVSADGFGTRVQADEVYIDTTRPILLAHTVDGTPLTRAQGLVRLIVPSEVDDALRQVKWVAEIRIR